MSPRLAQDECERECSRQGLLYDYWEDEPKQDALDEHKSCIMDATCDDLLDDVCYQDDLFVF